MKTIKSVNVGSFALYGAVLAALWTFVIGRLLLASGLDLRRPGVV